MTYNPNVSPRSGNLVFAAKHAHIVEAIEECCPPVTATYLQAAYDRMKLCEKHGIRVSYGSGVEFRNWFNVRWDWQRGLCSGHIEYHPTAPATLRAYFARISQLSPPGDTAGEQSSAHSIRSTATPVDATTPAVVAADATDPPASAAPFIGGL